MKAISFPFAIKNGCVDYTTDYKGIWMDRVRDAISTEYGTRTMRPTFGTKILDGILQYEDGDSEDLKNNVIQGISRSVPEISPVSVTESFDLNTGTLMIDVLFMTPDKSVVSTNTKYDAFGMFEEDLPLLTRE